uniref:WGS project CAEQ00000000 data, annotated contig 768 n=1 Tax=Trypanosoma congolense (strain IL3000) TaxID=1068625 RepID=F9WID0_TRYCI|nr:unnamed protein product [Trypanosoma congolense IL3000]
MVSSGTWQNRTFGYTSLCSNDVIPKIADEDTPRQHSCRNTDMSIPQFHTLMQTNPSIRMCSMSAQSERGNHVPQQEELSKHNSLHMPLGSSGKRETVAFCRYEQQHPCGGTLTGSGNRIEVQAGLDDEYHQDYEVFDALSITTTSSCAFGLGLGGLKQLSATGNEMRFLSLLNQVSSTPGMEENDRELPNELEASKELDCLAEKTTTLHNKSVSMPSVMQNADASMSGPISFTSGVAGAFNPSVTYAFEEHVYTMKMKMKHDNSLSISRHFDKARNLYDESLTSCVEEVLFADKDEESSPGTCTQSPKEKWEHAVVAPQHGQHIIGFGCYFTFPQWLGEPYSSCLPRSREAAVWHWLKNVIDPEERIEREGEGNKGS